MSRSTEVNLARLLSMRANRRATMPTGAAGRMINRRLREPGHRRQSDFDPSPLLRRAL